MVVVGVVVAGIEKVAVGGGGRDGPPVATLEAGLPVSPVGHVRVLVVGPAEEEKLRLLSGQIISTKIIVNYNKEKKSKPATKKISVKEREEQQKCNQVLLPSTSAKESERTLNKFGPMSTTNNSGYERDALLAGHEVVCRQPLTQLGEHGHCVTRNINAATLFNLEAAWHLGIK